MPRRRWRRRRAKVVAASMPARSPSNASASDKRRTAQGPRPHAGANLFGERPEPFPYAPAMSKEERLRARRRGRWGERLAECWLLGKGFRTIGRGMRTPVGEIDLIVRR